MPECLSSASEMFGCFLSPTKSRIRQLQIDGKSESDKAEMAFEFHSYFQSLFARDENKHIVITCDNDASRVLLEQGIVS